MRHMREGVPGAGVKMGNTSEPRPVRLLVGIIACDEKIIETAVPMMVEQWGPIDARSGTIPFDFTDYYEKEMGKGLLRQWVSFSRLISPADLAGIKAGANNIECRLAVDGRRRINLDPGFVDSARLVLASTKDFSHRIYLSGGIYAEITMIYGKGHFRFLGWTYPDYRSDTALNFFREIRNKYIADSAMSAEPLKHYEGDK